MLQVVAEATFTLNRVKFFAEYQTGSGGPNLRFDIYQGQLLEPVAAPASPAPNGLWLGGGLGPGAPAAENGGIIEILISGDDPINIVAGQNYVLYFRSTGGTYNILSAEAVTLQDPGIAVGGSNAGNLLAPNASLAAEITAKGFNHIFEDARTRPCCHLYSI